MKLIKTEKYISFFERETLLINYFNVNHTIQYRGEKNYDLTTETSKVKVFTKIILQTFKGNNLKLDNQKIC